MTTVYWGTYPEDYAVPNKLALLYFEPEPVLPQIIKSREGDHQSHFTKCPAFKDYYRNTYVVRSPTDIKIVYNAETKRLDISPQDQHFYDKYITYRGHHGGDKDPFCMSIEFRYMFTSDKDCMVEQLPVTFHNAPNINNIRVISGTFDIAKWYRPLNFAFEMLTDTLHIKRGDPLFYVRFLPKDGGKVKLVRYDYSSDDLNKIQACLDVKAVQPKLPLNTLYKLTEYIRSNMSFNKKKCPFNWRNK